jgi:hypothetical protein
MPIYRKGEGQLDPDGRHTELRNAALQQRIAEVGANRNNMGEQLKRDTASGLEGARNVMRNTDIQNMIDYPETFGGPVSGSHLARLKDMEVEKKRTKAKEMKRR